MRGTEPPISLRNDNNVLTYIECSENLMFILREYRPQNRT